MATANPKPVVSNLASEGMSQTLAGEATAFVDKSSILLLNPKPETLNPKP